MYVKVYLHVYTNPNDAKCADSGLHVLLLKLQYSQFKVQAYC